MAYTEKQIQSMLVPIGQLYKAGCLNYRGKADSGRCYQEICAEHLLRTKFPELIRNPSLKITRTGSYNIIRHGGEIKKSVTNREEEHLAKVIFNTFKDKKQNPLGEMYNYQVPLKNNRTDDAGKIDLISYDGETLYLIELKKGDSSETLLRCIMEIATYAQVIDSKKLLEDYFLPANTKIQATVLFPEENKNLSEDCKNAVSGAMGNLEKLRNKLLVSVCSLEWAGKEFGKELIQAENGTSGASKIKLETGLYSFEDASITITLKLP